MSSDVFTLIKKMKLVVNQDWLNKKEKENKLLASTPS